MLKQVGKNFSTNNVGGKRRKSDFYETPFSLTTQLLECETFPTLILEPAAGAGAIVRVLMQHGHDVVFYDKETDFLLEQSQYPAIITNPPYSLADEFILHAKQIAQEKFAFLLPLSYLHGKARYDTIYQDTEFPLARVHVFTRYPLLGDPLRTDGKYRTGMMVYAWYVWDRMHRGRPHLGWINNHCFVLTKKDGGVE